MGKELLIHRRVTTPFLQAVPPQVEYFDAYLYAVVKRRHHQPGTEVKLDPCVLDWTSKIITIHIPFNINEGITSFDDLDPLFFEAIEAAFLALIFGCLP